MERKDDVGAVADRELRFDGNAGRRQGVDLLDQRRGIDDDAVADDGFHAVAQDAAGNQLENELLLADKNRVPGIVAALIARDDVEMLGKQVDNFAFAFIAPLSAKHNQITHSSPTQCIELALQVACEIAQNL